MTVHHLHHLHYHRLHLLLLIRLDKHTTLGTTWYWVRVVLGASWQSTSRLGYQLTGNRVSCSRGSLLLTEMQFCIFFWFICLMVCCVYFLVVFVSLVVSTSDSIAWKDSSSKWPKQLCVEWDINLSSHSCNVNSCRPTRVHDVHTCRHLKHPWVTCPSHFAAVVIGSRVFSCVWSLCE